ncbi:hypothetical protein SISNIDRAFT_447629 [Sistotremastrum niveocremeum HHB9708]|uniref:MYND-type domain-containing protein n=1 Tax=Sistotremastrum niveocremeum HHB9708 TaxID=1314777 RepID=A0A165AD16_9AGAM|nr:hypothetical protein SISNIDRAFT_447629 [Sistotremastrum niveocremeum HHB9708]
MPRSCVVCQTPTKKTCTGCSRIAYCSKPCQKKDWITHILQCDKPGREITTADRLAGMVYNISEYRDQQTIADWGFHLVRNREDERSLSEVYHNVIRIIGVKPPTLHQWRIEGRLHAELVAAFRGAGRTDSDATFVWLRRHPEVFVPQTERSNHLLRINEFAVALRKAWVYIGGSEKTYLHAMSTEVKTWPSTKNLCLTFYVVILHGCRPPIETSEVWVKFGFCAFPEYENGIRLRSLYPLLLRTCTFDEFSEAFATSSLIALMDKKGLKDLRTTMPEEFEIVLSQSPNRISCVWALKAFVLVPFREPLSPEILPFGFSNCKDSAEMKNLARFYVRVFNEWKVPPLELERAAAKDRIFDYLLKLPAVKISNAEKRFLKRVLETQNQLKWGGKLPPCTTYQT